MKHIKTLNVVATTTLIVATMATMTACGDPEAITQTTKSTSVTTSTASGSTNSDDVGMTKDATAASVPTPMTKAEMDAEHEKVAISREALTLEQTEAYVKYVEADGGLGFRSNLVIPHDPANKITCDKAMGEYLGNVNYSANNGHCTLVVPSKGATYDVKLQYVTDTTANVRREIVVKKH